MTDLLLRLLFKLLTESFISKMVIYSLDAWAKTTASDWDDKVVKAMADALDVPVEKLKP